MSLLKSLAAGLLLVAHVSVAGAEPAVEKGSESANRTLGDHTYILPELVNTAFVLTYVGLRVGASSLQAPNIETRAGTFELNSAASEINIDLGLKLHERIGLTAGGSIAALLGTNTPTLVYRGAQYYFSGYAGAIVMLLRNESSRTQLSARARVGASQGKAFALENLFQDEGVRVVLPDVVVGGLRPFLTTPNNTRSVGGSLALAQGITRALTLQADAGVYFARDIYQRYNAILGRRVDFDVNSWFVEPGAALTFDGSGSGIPLALMGEYSPAFTHTQSDLSGEDRWYIRHAAAAGVYYTGRRNLMLGLVGVARWQLERFRPSGEQPQRPHALGGRLVLGYVW